MLHRDNQSPFLGIQISIPSSWTDYALLDSGDGLKLEKYGDYQLIRPETEALWKPTLSDEWHHAHAIFQHGKGEESGTWEYQKPISHQWQMQYGQLKFLVKLSTSRHLGIFPEQAEQWDWIEEKTQESDKPLKVLNLFGYTGIATLAAARAGALVTHVDASSRAINWARENQALNQLEEKPIRWINDDALKFIRREFRRGNQYDGIILDPPKFGRGPKGEVWQFYKWIPSLLEACQQVLSADPQFVLLTAYAVKASALTLYQAIQSTMRSWHGITQAGELALKEKYAGRLLSRAIYASWSKS